MLGKGWFPDQLGGLNRYFRDLLEHQPEATGVVIGPATEHPQRLIAVSRHDARLPWRLLAFRAAARRAARGANVIDAHFALYALLPLLSRRLRAIPLVVHFQGPWADENVAQGDTSALRRSMRRALERIVFRRAQRVIVLSSAFRRLCVERYRVSPWRVRVEPPGVDLERFSPGDSARARGRLEIEGCSFVAVAVRRLVPRMGLDVLIDAWSQALPELPQQARLLIAGEGALREELERRIALSGLQDSVKLLGRIDDDMLVELYRAADVGIVPTRSFEGFGLVVIEAAACGTPTIVTRIGGLPEAVAGLDPSLAVAAGDASALASRIARAARAGGLPGRDETRRFAERCSWPAVVDRTRAVQREALAPETADRRMRVVYLDHVGQLSGGEIALLRLVPHLTDVEPHVVLAEDGPFADALVQAGISTEVLPMAERARNLRKGSVTPRVPIGAVAVTAAYIVRLALYLRRLQPDIVHTNSLKAGVYGSIAARLACVPVVWHVRDRIAADYLPAPAVSLVRFMTRRLTAAVIANSMSTMKTLGRAHPRSAIVYSGVPDALIASAASRRLREVPLTVGIIGRLAPWKGQDLFLRAFAEAFPGDATRCVVVGGALFGEDAFECGLQELSDELGLGGRLEFRGFRADIWPELARMDILVHASRIPEPFGQVVLEGMAARVTVVAPDAGGPAEIICHDVNGVLYPIGSQRGLAGAMRQLAGDRERRERLADAGVETAAAYSPRKTGKRLENLYRDVISCPKVDSRA